MKITVLCTDQAHPIVLYLVEWLDEMSSRGHSVSLVFDKSELMGGDVLFLVSCSQIIKNDDLKKYKTSLVLHASDLPQGRGWSPHIWEILNSKNVITVSLIEASDPVDSGQIWLQKTISFQGHELLDEINAQLFAAELYLMTTVIDNFQNITPIDQKGDAGEWRRKRTPEDSRLDPYKSIADQFNLLRVVDEKRYPAFFEYCGIKYLLKIEKAKSE